MSRDLRAWAAERGLAHQEVGPLLEPYTPVLRRGLGAGEHRASRVIRHTARSTTSTGGWKKLPERQTRERCAGRLPGGLDGVLAHQVHLELSSRVGGEGGEAWGAFTTTVVVARLPERLRAVCELDAQPGRYQPATALASVDLSGGGSGPLDVIVPPPRRLAERDGWLWRLTPPEDLETLDAIDHPGVRAALADAPPDTRIELVEGVVCVSAPGALKGPGQLDALCHVAAALADGVRAAVARFEPLTAEAPVGPPAADTERARWVDAGVATVTWPSPPPSVEHAVHAYGQVAAGRAVRAGRRVHRIALVALLVFALLGCIGGIGFALLFDDVLGIVIAVVSLGFGVRGAFRAARDAGAEVQTDLVESRARPWAVEAFARGYAASRGLVLEDPQELRHRLDSPVAGRPIRAWHGDLGEGVPGHLALWWEVLPGGAARHWLIAVVRAPEGDAPAAPAPYVATRRGDLLVVGVPVAPADRSAAGLDALAAVARRLAAAPASVRTSQ